MSPPTTPSPLPPTNTNSQASSSLSPPSTQSRLAQNTISYLLFPKKGASKDETDGFRQILDSVVVEAIGAAVGAVVGARGVVVQLGT